MTGHVMQLTSPPRGGHPWWPRALCSCGWESDECATADDARDRHAVHVEEQRQRASEAA